MRQQGYRGEGDGTEGTEGCGARDGPEHQKAEAHLEIEKMGEGKRGPQNTF